MAAAISTLAAAAAAFSMFALSAEGAMKVVMQMVQDTETATDDLQVRLNRLNCQEQNIDAQLAYVFAVRR